MTLSHQDAPPKKSILLPKHTTALTALIPSLFRKQSTTFIVAFTSILAEFLVVALSGLPYRSGQLADEFFFCGVTALVILAVMVLVIAAVNFWRRALPHLPRKPDSAGNVMTYLADSKMVNDFEGVERMGNKQRDAWIETLGKRYEYALRRRDDGRVRWAVDHVSKGDLDDESILPPDTVWVNARSHGRQVSMSRFD